MGAKGRISGVMLNWFFCLAVVSELTHLWVRGEKVWDVESDTPEEAPSFFLLPAGIFCGTSRSTFPHAGWLL